MNIVYEDAQIIVCEKPSGVPTQSSRPDTEDMVSLLKNYIYEKEKQPEPYLGVIHRLDQPVQGIMVFTKTSAAAKDLSRQIAQGLTKKFYLAVSCGRMEEKQGQLVNYLVKDSKLNSTFIVANNMPEGKRSELNYKVLQTKEKMNLLEIELITGRHHQIRVQMSNLGNPLWGDTKYNPDFVGRQDWSQLALCGYRIEFSHPKTKKVMKFQIQPSADIFKNFDFKNFTSQVS